MKTKKTLSILIPAYNEGEGAARLVKSVLKQKITMAKLSQIIVVSDGSTDNTVDSLKSIRSKILRIVNSRARKGKAERLNQMFNLSNTDYAVVFDSDIVLEGQNCIEKLIKPLVNNKADMTSSAINELSPVTYFEEVLDVSMKLKRVLFNNFKKGNNVYNCHGPARGFTKELYKKMRFSQSAGEDMFSYLYTLKINKKFAYTLESSVSYRLPSVAKDHYKQSYRYLNAIDDMKKTFGEDFVNQEFNIPFGVYIKSLVYAIPLIIKYPTHIFVYILTILFTYIGKFIKISPKELWQVSSSKNIKLYA